MGWSTSARWYVITLQYALAQRVNYVDTLSYSGSQQIWWSARSLSGALATPVFFLGFVDSVLTILFFNLLGILPVAFFSTFGPVFGLRQMVLSRFFYGFYGVKISACLLSLLFRFCFDIYIQLLYSTSLRALAGLVLTLSLVLSCYTQ